MTDSEPTSRKDGITLVLTRLTGISKDCALGVLQFPDGFTLATIERFYDDNKVGVSSIPLGKYLCRRRKASGGITAGHGEAFEVCHVRGRADILFHVANLVSELRGCIGLGQIFGRIGSEDAVMFSTNAFYDFMNKLEGVEEFELVIRNMASNERE